MDDHQEGPRIVVGDTVLDEPAARRALERAGFHERNGVWSNLDGETLVLTRQRLGWPHNVMAHPLLVLCPPVGRWLHERTSTEVPTWGGRLRAIRAGWWRSTFGQRTV